MIWSAVSKGPESGVFPLFQGGNCVFLEVWSLPLKKTMPVLNKYVSLLQKKFLRHLSLSDKRKHVITGFLAL